MTPAVPLAPLFPHQEQAASRLAKRVPTYLGFDMGIGKTRTFLEAVTRNKAKRVLVICPASAIGVWKTEISRWTGNQDYIAVRSPGDLIRPGIRFFIVSLGLMSQRGGAVAGGLDQCPPFDMTALDEAHAFNAADTLRVQTLRRVFNRLGQVVPLSGTPMRNHAGDLYTLTSLCWPDGLRTMSGGFITRHDYESVFCVTETRRIAGGRRIRVITGSKNIPKLRAMLAPFMLRVRKEDVLTDLPAINWDRVPVPLDPATMPPADAEAFDAAVEATLNAAGMKPGEARDAVLNVLSGAGGEHLMRLRRLLGLAKLKGAYEYLTDMLEMLPDDRKILVFAVHADVIGALERFFLPYNPAVITGATPRGERMAIADKFLTDPTCRLFIGNIQAAGTALTLVGPTCRCSDVVFVESSWTPADNAQAACRVHRIGQKDGVVARMLAADGTIDALIQNLLVRKAGEFTQMFDTQKTTGEAV